MPITISVSIDSNNSEVSTAAAGLAFLAGCCNLDDPPLADCHGLEALSLILLWASDATHAKTEDRILFGGPLSENDSPYQAFFRASMNLFEVNARLERFLGLVSDPEEQQE